MFQIHFGVKMVCRGAGVSPVIFLLSTRCKNAGGTPAPQKHAFPDKSHLSLVCDPERHEKYGSSGRYFFSEMSMEARVVSQSSFMVQLLPA
jgi:hypothetical protein